MTEFRYRYRKTALLWQIVLGFFFLGFVLFCLRTASFILGDTANISGHSDSSPFAIAGFMFTFVFMIMIAAGLWLIIPTLIKILVPLNIIAGDEQGLSVRGPWLKNYYFSWSDIDYLRYEKRLSYYRSSNSRHTVLETMNEILLIKPLQSKSVRINVTYLDGSIDDIVADIRRYLPNIKVNGLDI